MVVLYDTSTFAHSFWLIRTCSAETGSVLLECVYEEGVLSKGVPPGPASRIFSCTMDLPSTKSRRPTACQVVCLFRGPALPSAVREEVANTLHGYAIEEPSAEGIVSVSPCFALPALAAAPVNAMGTLFNPARPTSHLLILHPLDCGLHLYAGACPLARCALPANLTEGALQRSSDNPPRSLRQLEIVDLKDPVGARISIVFADGSCQRVSVDIAPRSKLLRDCLCALSCVLPTETLQRVAVGCGIPSSVRSLPEPPSTTNQEWHRFACLLTHLTVGRRGGRGQGLDGSVRGPSIQGRPSLLATPTSDTAASAPWEQLLASDYHHAQQGNYALHRLAYPAAASFVQNASAVHEGMEWESLPREEEGDGLPDEETEKAWLDCLHLVYEDSKLDLLKESELPLLGRILFFFAHRLNLSLYEDHYRRDHGCLAYRTNLSDVPSSGAAEGPCSPPPCIYSWLLKSLSSGNDGLFPVLVPPCDTTRTVCRIYEALAGRDDTRYLSRRRTAWSEPDDAYPLLSPGLLFPSLRAQRRDDEEAEHGSTGLRSSAEKAVRIMGEEGLTPFRLERIPSGVVLPLKEAIRTCRCNPPGDWPRSLYLLIGREDLALPAVQLSDIRSPPLVPEEEGEEAAAVSQGSPSALPQVSHLRFGSDHRLKEVARMLCSSEARLIHLVCQTGMSEQDMAAEQQRLLLNTAMRTMALPVGRGLFTLATSTPRLTELIPIPPLVLDGKIKNSPTTSVPLQLEASAVPAEGLGWAQFHNGVAAGLSVLPPHPGVAARHSLSSTWIVYNKPDELSNEHAGLLMGLGLQGHLAALGLTKVFDYLSKGHAMTSIGLLLGMASARRGTMDPSVTKLLSIHIPALHPPSSTDLEVPPAVQTAAVVGIGLVYEATAHRHVVEVLLNEIGRNPSEDRRQDREGYALAAGLALGMVTLGRGRNAPGLSDMDIEDTLRRYIDGGSRPRVRGSAPPADAMASVGPKHGPSSLGMGAQQAAAGHSSLVLEGPGVNVDITAAGAMAALGLMFLKTNSTAVAERMAIPSTVFLLEIMRPDLLLLRVLCRSLIMWDAIQPTLSWIQSHLPFVLLSHLRAPNSYPTCMHRDTAQQACMNVTAGACMAIGMRFAGTADREAADVLLAQLEKFSVWRAGRPGEGADQVESAMAESLLCAVALSLALVMAGTGNVRCLSVLRALHKRVSVGVSYGNHMALSTAVSLLFLGAGRYTLSTSNASIAAMLAALYPLYPAFPNDNRYHLQALRHLLVLAAEPRCVTVVDVDSKLVCPLPLRITLHSSEQRGGKTVQCVAPCLVPEFEMIADISVDSPRYWHRCLDVAGNAQHGELLRNTRTIYVKKKAGYQGYIEDPTGWRSILGRGDPWNGVVGALHSSSSSSSVDMPALAFAKYFCNLSEGNENGDRQAPRVSPAALPADYLRTFDGFVRGILYDCLAREKMESVCVQLGIWLPLARLMEARTVPRGLAGWVWSLRLMEARYRRCIGSSDSPLVDGRLLQGVILALPPFLQPTDPDQVVGTYIASATFPTTVSGAALFGCYLHYHSIPHPLQLSRWQQEQSCADTNWKPLLSLAQRFPLISFHTATCLLRVAPHKAG